MIQYPDQSRSGTTTAQLRNEFHEKEKSRVPNLLKKETEDELEKEDGTTTAVELMPPYISPFCLAMLKLTVETTIAKAATHARAETIETANIGKFHWR